MKTLYQILYESETTPPELNVKRYKGDLDLTKYPNVSRIEKLQIVMGDLTNEIVETPNLIFVSRWLNLWSSQIQELPILKEVGEYLDLKNSQILELPNLVEVGRYLNLENSKIQELPKLEKVGADLNLRYSQIQELPKLEKVEKYIWVEYEKLDYWKDYFSNTGRHHLAEKVIYR
jgi:hypothetical protein